MFGPAPGAALGNAYIKAPPRGNSSESPILTAKTGHFDRRSADWHQKRRLKDAIKVNVAAFWAVI
jgi:hypothetical protein